MTMSSLMGSPNVAKCGAINLEKKEWMVPIGASSRSIVSCSLSASERSLGSEFCSLSLVPTLRLDILSLKRVLISLAAAFVNVRRTTSPGNRPFQRVGSVISVFDERILPRGAILGRSGWGSISVARCLFAK